MTDTLDKVKTSVRTVKPDLEGELTGETSISMLELSSLDQVQLMMTIEDAFDIEISQAQASTCTTLNDLAALVERLQA